VISNGANKGNNLPDFFGKTGSNSKTMTHSLVSAGNNAAASSEN